MGVINIGMPTLQEDYMVKYMRSVIEERAVPDVRDGLKPIHRYCIWDEYDKDCMPNKPHAKCAMTVGSVIGYYSPHGDASTYDALVRLAQNFSVNIPMIDGHGNFGTINGDSPAAYRYTESRLSKFGLELCDDINKNAVDFVQNYSNIRTEPTVLPAKVCNLLIQGSSGIAVGFSNGIPAHNINDVCDMTIELIKNPDMTDEEVAKKLKPDFPTGGIICNSSDLVKAYTTGKGSIRIRSHVEIKEHKNGTSSIIIKDVPYGVTIGPRMKTGSTNTEGGLINSIVAKVKDGTIEGIQDIQDHSNKFPDIEIDIKIKKNYDPNVILQQLYKYTKLEDTFTIQIVCLNNKTYGYYSVKRILSEFIDFRRDTIKRINVFDINKLKRRIHILEGLIIAHSDIDSVIAIIKKSADRATAAKALKKKLPKLTTVQIEYILDLKLSNLTSLEINKLNEEKKEKELEVADLMENLKKENIDKRIIDEQNKAKKEYGRPRRTECCDIDTNITEADVIPKEDCFVVLTMNNYAKRLPRDQIKIQKRNTQGNNTYNDDTKQVISTNTKDHLLCFTNTGRVFDIKVYQIAECNIKNKGMKLPLNLKAGEKIVTFLCVSDEDLNDHSYLMFVTKNGYGKKTALSEFKNINSAGIIAIDLKDNDSIVFVGHLDENKDMQDIIIGTEKGLVVRYDTHEEFKPIGRTTMGNTVIKLGEEDHVTSACIIDSDDTKLLFVTKNGLAKVTLVTDNVKKKDPNTKKIVNINDGFPRLKRSATIKGRIGISLKGDKLSSIVPAENSYMVVITTKKVLGTDISEFIDNPLKRPTMGKKLINIKDEDDYVVTCTIC